MMLPVPPARLLLLLLVRSAAAAAEQRWLLLLLAAAWICQRLQGTALSRVYGIQQVLQQEHQQAHHWVLLLQRKHRA
jgi:hypothetical protein